MKNFFLAMLTIFICASCSVAQAVTHSTQENFNYVFKMCISAIYETEDYHALLEKGDDDVVVLRMQDCKNHQENLEFFWSNGTAQGAESLSIMLETIVIMQSRYATLDYFLEAINAYRMGKVGLYEEYGRRSAKAYAEAERFRQDFRNKYGY